MQIRFSRLWILACLVVGACMFLIFVPVYFLAHAQALEYVRANFPVFYAWFIQLKTVIALEIVGLGLLAVALFEMWVQREKSAENPPALPASQSQSANATGGSATGGNAKIDFHLHAAPPPPPQKSPPPIMVPSPKPNILFKNVRPAWIRPLGNENFFAEAPDSQNTFRGVIARFKNESAAHGVCDAEFVRAELVMRDVNEQELEQGVHAACWLREATDTAAFDVGQDQWLLLGIVDRSDNKYWGAPFMKSKTTWEGTEYELDGYRVLGMRSIEVRLIWESKLLTAPVVVDIVVNDGEPKVAVRSHS